MLRWILEWRYHHAVAARLKALKEELSRDSHGVPW